MNWKKILTIVLMAAVFASGADMDAKSRRKRKRKARTTRVVKKKTVTYDTPVTVGKMEPHEPFVTYEREHPVTAGLDNRIIALWQSHGLYYDQKQERWKWQRPQLFGTVEDLFAQGFVMPYLTPMLENAGAYVMTPRERDLSLTEIISDTDGSAGSDFYLTEGKYQWEESVAGEGFAFREVLHGNDNPFVSGTSEKVRTIGADDAAEESTANWTADIPQRGRYAVYVSYRSYPNSATDATYTVNHLGGATKVTVNQTMGGGTWIYLGHFDLAKGKPRLPVVTLTNVSDDEDAVVSADAVKIGGGMGNVARAPLGSACDYASGMPRFTEGARYWLQWAGMPESVYNESKGTNDYTDDYKSRALWVNYLAGGSPMLPDSVGLGIPVDMAFAFHTDAGTRDDGTVVGTLGIYSTDDGVRLGNNRSRSECGDLANTVINQIVEDMRALHLSDWSARGVRDRKYYEIRETKVPAMILELLSHQNFEDMKYGLNPQFRFDVARAVYKGILKFVSRRYGVKYVVQPLPVNSFAISAGASGHYRLTWRPTIDHLELSAMPKYYVVEERVENGAFVPVATVKDTRYDVEVPADGQIHSYRIVAGNAGGTSFASEVLALYNSGSQRPEVNVVNGFTRISAPDDFTTGEFGGFNYQADGGVADGYDIISTGAQYDYRLDSEYQDNDRPGFGASHGNMARTVTAGNTFDFVYLHGRALRAAGCGFVSSSAEAFAGQSNIAAPGSPSNPAIVDLILGKQKEIMPASGEKGTRYKAFPAALRRRIEDHCGAGGSLMVSGAYIGSDLMDNRYSDQDTRTTDAFFASSVLGYTWQLSQAAVDGKVSIVPSKFRQFAPAHLSFQVEASPDSYAVESPDALEPSGISSAAVMRYDENGLPAAVASEKTMETASGAVDYRVFAMGFPFETIRTEQARARLMTEVMAFLRRNGSH